MQRDKAYILDIFEACNKITSFTGETTKESFKNDLKTQSAVMHQLLIMGEAVKRLSDKFREEHNSIDWTLIAGMRDRLIHQYDAVDLEIIWNTI
jgi:uncharacterized protein with HEPN domain